MSIIEVKNLTKIYGRHAACRGICLSVEEGQIFGLLGPNGAGKSTVVKVLVGLVYPTEGEVRVAGYLPQDKRARRQIGFLPENFRLHGWLKGEELLFFHARLAGIRGEEARRQARNVLELVGLAREGQRQVALYSKGMQQRLALATALVGKPKIVFLDEPTSALDPLGRRQVREILLSLKETGITVFLNSHLLSEVERVCDQVAILSGGTLLTSGSLTEMLDSQMSITVRLKGLRKEDELELQQRYSLLRIKEDCLNLAVNSEEDIPDLISWLTARGCRLYEVIPNHNSLEEIFIKLVKGGEETCG